MSPTSIRILDMGLLQPPLQISLVMGVNGGIRPNARNVAFMSEQIPGGPEGPNNWQVIGVSRDQWKLLAASLNLGGNVRAGLEDNLYLPDGEMAKSNGELIAKAARWPRTSVVAPPRSPRLARCSVCRGARRLLHEREPLEDVRILDLTRLLPGGFCTLLLADLGADVIKVEDTGQGDYVRWAPPYYGSEEQTPLGTRSAIYLSLNRNKRSIRLDLKHEQGRQALLRLAEIRGRPRGELPAGGTRQARRRLRRPAAGQPGPRLLPDHRLRPGRTEP